jgi:site-specific recombinase XerD
LATAPAQASVGGLNENKLIEPNVLHARCHSVVAVASVDKRANVHVSRDSFATHPLQNGTDIRITKVPLCRENLVDDSALHHGL